MAKRMNPVLRFARALLPIAVGIISVIIAFETWLVYRLTHPRQMAYEVTPTRYQVITGGGMSWSEETWQNLDGTQAKGWFLRGITGAPAVVLNHGYGTNRAELLNLGVKLCENGYHVLLPDLRGHGESPVKHCSLGVYEKLDLLDAISFLKSKKNPQGQMLIDQNRVGVYGVSLGGYAAITAAAENTAIKLVVADSVYPRPDWLTQSLLKEMFNSAPQVINQFTNWGLNGYFWGQFEAVSAEDAVTKFKGQKLWLVTGQSNTPETTNQNQTTMDLFQQAQSPKEILRLERPRREAQDAYDDRIVGIFRKDLAR